MIRTRQSMLWLMAAAGSAAAAAVMAQPVPAALQACVHMTQDSERLACFDREMAAASQKAGTPAAAASKPAQAPAGNGAASPARAPASASTALTGAGAVGATAGAAAASAATAATSPTARSTPPAASAPSALPAASAPVATSATGTTTAAVPLTPEDKLGLSTEGIHKLEVERGIKSAAAKPSQELTAHVASVSRNAAGRAVLTLDNGQVWRQSETRSSFEARAGDAVKITPGVMGSFWLSTNTHNWTRVERLP